MLDHKEEAELLRFGLVAGYRRVADAVRWADDIITAESELPVEILDISPAGRQSPGDVAALLAKIPGTYDAVAVRRRWLGEPLQLVQAQPAQADEVARWLYELFVTGDLPEAQFGYGPNALDDSFDLARRTIIPREEAMRQLLEYLTRASRPAT